MTKLFVITKKHEGEDVYLRWYDKLICREDWVGGVELAALFHARDVEYLQKALAPQIASGWQITRYDPVRETVPRLFVHEILQPWDSCPASLGERLQDLIELYCIQHNYNLHSWHPITGSDVEAIMVFEWRPLPKSQAVHLDADTTFALSLRW